MGRDGANGIISYQHLPCLAQAREWRLGVLTVLWSLKFQERNLGSPYTYTQSVGLGPQGGIRLGGQQYKPVLQKRPGSGMQRGRIQGTRM